VAILGCKLAFLRGGVRETSEISLSKNTWVLSVSVESWDQRGLDIKVVIRILAQLNVCESPHSKRTHDPRHRLVDRIISMRLKLCKLGSKQRLSTRQRATFVAALANF